MTGPKKQRKFLTEDELKRLFAVIHKHGNVRDIAIFTVTYWRGLRASEVGLIPYNAWNRSGHRLYVARLKNSNDGEFAICKAEHIALTRWALIRGNATGPLFTSQKSRAIGRGISRQQLDEIFRKYATEADLPDHLRHVHCLKHSIGTHLIAKGEDISVVQDWLGHKAIQNTMIYAQFRNAQRDAAAQRIYSQG